MIARVRRVVVLLVLVVGMLQGGFAALGQGPAQEADLAAASRVLLPALATGSTLSTPPTPTPSPTPPTTPTFSLSVSMVGSGNVSLNPGGGVYPQGATVQLTAVAASGWRFVGWSGALSGTSNPASITMTQNHAVTAHFSEVSSGEAINVWYGSTQRFGHLGRPQPFVNILGNVSDPDGIASLRYRLNGGPSLALSLGPDTRRLANPGDFNIDIPDSSLVAGNNTVQITAVDGAGNSMTRTITVNYTPGRVWPLPYSANWSSAGSIQDVAQVVDGRWYLDGGTLRPVSGHFGYDRLVAIGDLAWESYEIEVPVQILWMSNVIEPPSFGSGVGVLVRWGGHNAFNPDNPEQPLSNYENNAALFWYRKNTSAPPSLKINDYRSDTIAEDPNRQLDLNRWYIWKMRVTPNPANPGGEAIYQLKVWAQGQPEPSGWHLSAIGSRGVVPRGSILLVAHNADVRFGQVQVRPAP